MRATGHSMFGSFQNFSHSPSLVWKQSGEVGKCGWSPNLSDQNTEVPVKWSLRTESVRMRVPVFLLRAGWGGRWERRLRRPYTVTASVPCDPVARGPLAGCEWSWEVSGKKRVSSSLLARFFWLVWEPNWHKTDKQEKMESVITIFMGEKEI